MNGGGRRTPFHDLAAVSAQVVRCDLCQQTIPPDGHEFAFEDGATHRACAVGHSCVGQPLLTELAETLCLLDPVLLPLLLNGGRTPLGYRTARVDA
jgi:hypothetical protein